MKILQPAAGLSSTQRVISLANLRSNIAVNNSDMSIFPSSRDTSLFDSFTRTPTPNDHHQKISGDGSGVLAMIKNAANGPSKPAFFLLLMI
jgi:hypothetical protein